MVSLVNISLLINSAVLKQVATFLEDGFFDYYIQRYEYELKCFDIGCEVLEKERLLKYLEKL
mgnify:CR=1 FL=1